MRGSFGNTTRSIANPPAASVVGEPIGAPLSSVNCTTVPGGNPAPMIRPTSPGRSTPGDTRNVGVNDPPTRSVAVADVPREPDTTNVASLAPPRVGVVAAGIAHDAPGLSVCPMQALRSKAN